MLLYGLIIAIYLACNNYYTKISIGAIRWGFFFHILDFFFYVCIILFILSKSNNLDYLLIFVQDET